MDELRQSWNLNARSIVQGLAKRNVEFTTDEVWAILNRAGEWDDIEPRSLGPVMLLARMDGIIRKVNKHRVSNNGLCHHRPKQVWIGADNDRRLR